MAHLPKGIAQLPPPEKKTLLFRLCLAGVDLKTRVGLQFKGFAQLVSPPQKTK